MCGMQFTRSSAKLRTLLLALPLAVACNSAGTASEPGAVDAATVERLRADVTWLADDAREGRRSGTDGERASATWIAERMIELGLEPAGEEGYFQRFPVPMTPSIGSPAVLGKRIPAPGGEGREMLVQQEDACEPLFCAVSGEVRGPLVFRGYGIVDEERDWNDYASGAVDGAIVLLVRGTPPAEEGSWGYGASVLHKVMTAKRHGAAAVLIVQSAADDSEPLSFSTGREANSGLPCLSVSAGAAGWLWGSDASEPSGADAQVIESLIAAGVSAEGPADVVLGVDVRRDPGTATNVLGVLRGRGEAPTVVVGAHYDHLGRGGSGSLAPDAVGQIHNGADDNASGTAAVLEVARQLTAQGPPAGDVIFALWSGEELGLIGSKHWCESPTVPLESVSMNLNMDMVGRGESNTFEVMGVGSSPPFGDWIIYVLENAGLDADLRISGFGIGGSDHQSFLAVGVPALHLFTGLHDDYHRPTDDVERFEAEGAARIVGLSVEIVHRSQASGELAFVAPPEDPNERGGGRRGFDVRFGSRPADYSEVGGLTLSGVSPGSPAERAGIMGGDTLLEVGGVTIDGIQDFVYVLRTHKPGDVVKTVFRRDGEEHEVLVTLDSNVVE